MSLSPSFVFKRWSRSPYVRPLASLTARFAVFFATLYFSMLFALLSKYRRRKQTFFSLIAFWTSSFHHQVSLASTLLPLVTPNSSEAILQTQVVIFIHILFASPSSSQGPSFMTLSLKA